MRNDMYSALCESIGRAEFEKTAFLGSRWFARQLAGAMGQTAWKPAIRIQNALMNHGLNGASQNAATRLFAEMGHTGPYKAINTAGLHRYTDLLGAEHVVRLGGTGMRDAYNATLRKRNLRALRKETSPVNGANTVNGAGTQSGANTVNGAGTQNGVNTVNGAGTQGGANGGFLSTPGGQMAAAVGAGYLFGRNS